MSARRQARAAGASVGFGLPAEVADPLDPLWRDVRALRAHPVFAAFVDGRVTERLRLGGRAYHSVVNRWAVAAGFESDKYPRTVDWRKLRLALTEGEKA